MYAKTFRFEFDPCRGRRADWQFGDWGFQFGKRRRGPMGGRLFDQGDLRIVILQLLADKPRHGYEIIKALEEKSGGAYAPSAGAVYPTLTLLEEMGHATSADDGGKKVYTITETGRAFLEQNRSTADDVFERIGDLGAAVFSDTMREAGRAFSRIARAAFHASSDQLRDGGTTRRIIEVLDRAASEIEEILRKPASSSGNPGQS
jgi:DNA-binding PadR family transcriptional regulator